VAGGAITATATWSAPADGASVITGYIVRALRMSGTGTVLQTITSPVQPATARSLPQTGSYRLHGAGQERGGHQPAVAPVEPGGWSVAARTGMSPRPPREGPVIFEVPGPFVATGAE
jgi:hypothetical protein